MRRSGLAGYLLLSCKVDLSERYSYEMDVDIGLCRASRSFLYLLKLSQQTGDDDRTAMITSRWSSKKGDIGMLICGP